MKTTLEIVIFITTVINMLYIIINKILLYAIKWNEISFSWIGKYPVPDWKTTAPFTRSSCAFRSCRARYNFVSEWYCLTRVFWNVSLPVWLFPSMLIMTRFLLLFSSPYIIAILLLSFNLFDVLVNLFFHTCPIHFFSLVLICGLKPKSQDNFFIISLSLPLLCFLPFLYYWKSWFYLNRWITFLRCTRSSTILKD